VELRRVNAASAPPQSDRVLKVQHLVIDDVFHGTARDGEVVKDAADDDRIVRGIVMSENAASPGLAPAHAWPCHQSMEKTGIQVFEDSVEIVEVSLRSAQPLASAHLPNQVGFAHDVMAGHVFAVAGGMAAVDGLAIHLGQQDVSNRPQYGLRRAFEQIGQAHQQLSLAQADGVIDVGKGEEFNPHLGRGR